MTARSVSLSRADQFCGKDSAVVQRDANVGRAVDDVVVGDDVTVRRNNHAAAEPVLDIAAAAAASGRISC